jgi:hypothetical protein
MPTPSVPEGRRSKRIVSKKRASLVLNLQRNQTRVPCLVLDATDRGLKAPREFPAETGTRCGTHLG